MSSSKDTSIWDKRSKKVVKEVSKDVAASPIYIALSKKERTRETLEELLTALKTTKKESKNQEEKLNIRDEGLEGTYLHYLTNTAKQDDDISWRMVYALSNAGLDVNKTNFKGSTALHCAYMRGYTELGYLFIEALLKVGSDLAKVNRYNKVPLDYMEQTEQFQTLYDSHTPSIWWAVEHSQLDDIYRLMNAWIKVDCLRDGQSLLEFSSKIASENRNNIISQTVLEVLKTCVTANNFVHAMYTFDVKAMTSILKIEGFALNPNMADYCYCFTWFNPRFRNLPRFILEFAFDSMHDGVIKLMLGQDPNVNLLHTKNGNPLFFMAYDRELKRLKNQILKNAKFTTKNYKGETVLFHILNLYLETNDKKEELEYQQFLLEEFNEILYKEPILIAERDLDDCSLIETILLMNREQGRKATEFLFLISKLLQSLLEQEFLEAFQNMIFKSFGLVLLNIEIFLDLNTTPKDRILDLHRRVPFLTYLEGSRSEKVKKCISSFIRYDFLNMVNSFFRAVRIGDLNTIMQIIELDKKKCITKMRDYSGRNCLHISVLYSRLQITRFLISKEPSLINSGDNLNRTPLHYACATKDVKQMEVLLVNKADELARDCKFLLPEEYQLEEVLTDEHFGVKNFRSNETRRTNGSHLFLKCFYTMRIRKEIANNSDVNLKLINEELKNYGLSFKDLPHYVQTNHFVNGKLYQPPLEYAIEKKALIAFRYILENTITEEAKKSMKTARVRSAFQPQMSNVNIQNLQVNRIKTARQRNDLKSSGNFVVLSRVFDLAALRAKAEKLELDEFLDVIDNIGEEPEIAELTRYDSTPIYDPTPAPVSTQDEVTAQEPNVTKKPERVQKSGTCVLL